MIECKHQQTREIRERGFTGSVSYYENRAAHGNICVTEECSACGARRERNVNGRHTEEGPWGPSRAERVAAERDRLCW